MQNWEEFFYYDETSPTGLRWKVEVRSGRNYHIVERSIGDVAGSIKCDGTHSSVKVNSKSYLVHRVIWEIQKGSIPKDKIIDHFDQNPLNNCISNLRLIDKPMNTRNAKMRSDNTSGTTGVSYNKRNRSWRASWCDASGKFRQKNFSITIYGEYAQNMAQLHRKAMIDLLNSEGKGYTERHGK